MKYQTNVKIVIDKRKLDTLIRLGVSDENLLSVIKTQRFEPTGDSLIDEYLSTLIDVKEFSNWGGNRENSGRKPKNNQLENQDDFKLENQDDFKLENQDDFKLENQDDCNLDDKDKDIDIDKDKDIMIDKKKGVKGEKEKKESTSSTPDTSRGVTEKKNTFEDNFNELWAIYKPYKTNSGRVVNKGGRSDAFRAYKNALKRGTHEEIKRGIYGYLKSCKENDTLSAMFSTFLNKDYWEEFKTFRCPEIDVKPVEKAPKVENTFEATFEYMEKENLKKEAEQAEWEQIKADLLKYAQRKNGDNR